MRLRWLLWISGGVVALGLILASFFITHTKSDHAVDQVTITGDLKYVDKSTLIHNLKPLINKEGFFAIELQQVQDIAQQSPWVAKAAVKRVWPYHIKITLHAYQPQAFWNQAGLVNAYGEVFYPPEVPRDLTLPHFYAPDDQQASLHMLDIYQQMTQLLEPIGLNITTLKLNADQSWEITLSNGMKLQLGREEILTRLRRFVKVYSKVFDSPRKQAEHVDLRYHNGMAVKWK